MSPHNDQYFNLSDCLKLDQNELKGIAEDALQKIQQKATSWWMKLKEEVRLFLHNFSYNIIIDIDI